MSSFDQPPFDQSSNPPSELPHAPVQALCQQVQIELQQDGKSADLITGLASVRPALQQYFAALSETWTEAEAAQAQPIQVEINKQLRLLEADSQFLGAARQGQTIQQRKQQIQQRLDLLLRYIAAMATLQADSEDAPPNRQS